MQIKINGIKVEVQPHMTILQAARKAGIDIPALCSMEGIHEIGSCRICVVEVKGARTLMPACITRVEEGMEVFTHTAKVRRARKTILELILSDHPEECLICAKNNQCELQKLAMQMNVQRVRYEGEYSPRIIDDESPAVVRDSAKCILCRRCVMVCSQIQGVNAIAPIGRGSRTIIAPAGRESIMNSPCVQCGQCVNVCPTGALTEKSHAARVWEALEDPGLYTVVQTAPAVRVAIGEMFGLDPGTPVTGKMVSALKRLGFDRVFDTNFSADLTIMEEVSELIQRINEGGQLPMITSCSPGWINYLEYFFPHLTGHLSTCKSPQQMFGAIIKTYYAEKAGIPADRIFTVSVMPCTAKKYESQRPEMHSSGYRDVDAVLTTRELGAMLKEAGIDLLSSSEQSFDEPFGPGSGAGAIFGNTGGVMEAALRTAYEMITGEELKNLEFHQVRNLDQVKEASVDIGGMQLSVAVVHGLGNIKEILEEIGQGKSPYHFIEVMCCPGGCIGGGGQPLSKDPEIRQKRIAGLYMEDQNLPVRKSHENPVIKQLYREFLGRPLGQKSHELLHTRYQNRRELIHSAY
jgi:NADH-quinone oxidoreductase subunit G/NADP-reducing hydrogenase subunit HndD